MYDHLGGSVALEPDWTIMICWSWP